MSGVRRPNDHLGILRQTIGEIDEIGNSVNPEDALELIYGCEGVHAHATALVRENGTIGDGDTVYFDGHTAEGLSLEALSNSLGALKLDVSRKKLFRRGRLILDVFMPANPEIGESLHSAKWQDDVTENTVDFTNVSRDDVKLAQYLHAVGAGAAYLLESLEYEQV